MIRKRKVLHPVRSVSGMFWRKDSRGRRRYCYDFELGGKRHSGSLGFNKEAAVRELERIRTRARLAAQGLADNLYPIGKLYGKYIAASRETLRESTLAQYIGSFRALWAFFDEKALVSELTPALMERYKASRLRDGKAARTVQLELTVFQAMLNFGVDANLIERNPVAKVRIAAARSEKEIFTAEEYEVLLNHQHPLKAHGKTVDVKRPCQCRALWCMFGESGLRLQEITNLMWKHVDMDARTIRVRKTERYLLKNDASVGDVPMTERLYDMLCIQRETTRHDPADLVFPTDTGKVMTRQNLADKLRRCLKASGIPKRKRSIHSLRHGFCTRLCLAGVHTSVAKTITRHASSRVLDAIYTHIGQAERITAMKAVQEMAKKSHMVHIQNSGEPEESS